MWKRLTVGSNVSLSYFVLNGNNFKVAIFITSRDLHKVTYDRDFGLPTHDV